MRLRTILLPTIACAGCLARDISHTIDQIHCSGVATETGGSSGTSGGGTTGCPETGETTGASSDTVGDTTGTGTEGTETDGGDAGSGSSSGSTDASSSTGEPMAVCGNGVVENFGPEPEDCDDANDEPADGCHDCGRERLAFVTSEDYQGSVFMGLEGADQRCRSLAAQQNLPNFAGFKAWLSDSKVSAKERMFRGRGRYVLVNGLVVVESWDALLAGELQNPINVTEKSETKNYLAWTGTMPDGSAAVGADHCADWSGLLDENLAFYGRNGEISSEWTIAEAFVGQPSVCASEIGLYCFEQK